MSKTKDAVLTLWSEGWTDEDIGEVLYISSKEVKRFRAEKRRRRG